MTKKKTDPDRPWKRPAPEVKQEFTNAEIDDVVGTISEADLRAASQKLDDAQEVYEDLAFIATEKIPCSECGGRGTMPAGSFGDIECPKCRGMRVVEHPGNDPFPMPPFAEMRAAITAYGNALADRLLPDGHPAKKGLALPPASTVPSLESLDQIMHNGRAQAREAKALKAASPAVDKLLEERVERRGDDVEDGVFTDVQLDEIEDEEKGR